MRVDTDQLRRQYANLSDGALLELNREDLTEVARNCYDEEVRKRGLDAAGPSRQRVRALEPAEGSAAAEGEDGGEPLDEAIEAGDPTEWLEGAAEVYSQHLHHAGQPARQALRAHGVLSAAGIPATLEMREEPAEDPNAEPVRRCAVLVPGELNLQATSVLEIEIFNKDFEADWRAHLGTLTDEQLEAADPAVTFGGLIDKIDRVSRAYDEELERRGIHQR
jgi:hypothetical protein